MEISKLRDKSNSTPPASSCPSPLATHAHMTMYTDAHTNTYAHAHGYVHTQAHTYTRAHVHTGMQTHPIKIKERKASRPSVNLLYNVRVPTLSRQGSSAPANSGACGMDDAGSLDLNSPFQVPLQATDSAGSPSKHPLGAGCSPSPVTGPGTHTG